MIMTGDQRHLFVAVKHMGDFPGQNQECDAHRALIQTIRDYLPEWIEPRIVSTDDSIDYSVFRHSTAPYWPDYDCSEPRILLKLSFAADVASELSPLQEVATLAGCALRIADYQPLDALCWPYAQLISEIGQLRAAMDRFMEGRDAPVLQFVRMSVRPDHVLTSNGLYYFCGQEIRLRATGDMSAAALVRRACRIAADAMLNGPFEKPVTVPGLAEGEQIRINPEPGGIWKGRVRWLSVECDVQQAVLSGMDL